jgi:hypothetical protein
VRQISLLAIIFCLCLLADASPALAQPKDAPLDAQHLVVMVLHNRAEGVVKLNGIPVSRFTSAGAEPGMMVTESLGSLSLFAENGPNLLSIEVAPAQAGDPIETECRIIVATGSIEDLDKPPLFDLKVKGAGTITQNLNLTHVPRWFFEDAPPWQGEKQDVIQAVQVLHKAFADRDMKAISASLHPMFTELSSVMGPGMGSFEDSMKQMQEWLKTAKVDPLPADLNVESFYGGRLFVVSGKAGAAPIRIASAEVDKDTGRPERLLESGQFWTRRNNQWVLIRQY